MPHAHGPIVQQPMPLQSSSGSSTKVKACWGKTTPEVQYTASVPVWHRRGWSTQYKHTDDLHRPDATAQCTTEHQDSPFACGSMAYARQHTHTHSHSQKQQAKHRFFSRVVQPTQHQVIASHCKLVLQQSWVPGMNGALAAETNHHAWCSELDCMQGELAHINSTLMGLREKAKQRRQHQQVVVDSNDTVALRAAVNASVANQMEFFTTFQAAWCSAGERRRQTAQ